MPSSRPQRTCQPTHQPASAIPHPRGHTSVLYGAGCTYIVPTPAARPQTSGRSPLNFSPSEWGSRQVEAMPWQPCQALKLGPGSLDCMACTLSVNLSVPGAHLFTICSADIPTIRIDLSIPLLICNRGEALRRTANTCHNTSRPGLAATTHRTLPKRRAGFLRTPGQVSPGSTPLSSQ